MKKIKKYFQACISFWWKKYSPPFRGDEKNTKYNGLIMHQPFKILSATNNGNQPLRILSEQHLTLWTYYYHIKDLYWSLFVTEYTAGFYTKSMKPCVVPGFCSWDVLPTLYFSQATLMPCPVLSPCLCMCFSLTWLSTRDSFAPPLPWTLVNVLETFWLSQLEVLLASSG